MTLLELAKQYRDRVNNHINYLKTKQRYDKTDETNYVIELAHWEGILRLAEEIVVRNETN